MSQRKDIGLNTNLWPKLVDHYKARTLAKQRAGITKSDTVSDYWVVGNDPKKRAQSNYIFSKDTGRQGQYWAYETNNGPKVVAYHSNDWDGSRLKIPHAHAYQPNTVSFKTPREQFINNVYYKPIGGNHHIWVENILGKKK